MPSERGAILVADADHGLRALVVDTLRKHNFNVHETATGNAALEALSQHPCDVVLCAVELPGFTGLEVLKQIQHQGLPVPVLLTTSSPRLETAVLAMRLGAVDYLIEPLSEKARVKRVDEAVKKARALRSMAEARQRASALVQSVGALEAALSGHHPPSETRIVAGAPSSDPLGRLDSDQLSRLSPREREVARMLARGNAISDLASELELSPNTVRNHVKSIFSKLRVHSQVELMSRLSGHGR